MSLDLSTRCLGLTLANPLVAGAGPLTANLDTIRALEDAGAGAIVLRSLFEEQITGRELGAAKHLYGHAPSAEAQSWFPDVDAFALGPDEYLEHVQRARAAVRVPVIGSLNGTTRGGWVHYARLIEEAGASALELNLYDVPTDPAADSIAVEDRLLGLVRDVRAAISIPLSVKLSPFFSSLPAFVRELEHAGANGIVLFNRFYQPDIDLEALELQRTLRLSDSSELPLRLRWLAVLSPITPLSLQASGGVHHGRDALKALMAGAHAVQLVSALLQRGPGHLAQVLTEMREWLLEHEYDSIETLRGSMNLKRCPDPAHYERSNYMALLGSWQ
ncbi:MAG: dihydroorotate dehydrogenase-like protein [Planctomycetes bacterium]|nr:dihydroorotate dehydrogenase-like protein [Planctomycetota bacterium]